MERRRLLAALGGAASAGLAGCLGMVTDGGGDYDVGMTDSAFTPERYTVSVGDTLVWKNTSGRAHSVTAYGGGLPEGAEFFASGGFDTTQAAREGWAEGEGEIYTGETFEHTFEVPGEHPYFCIPHERAGMRGTVVVEE
jgi:plastocyanin